MKNSKIEKLLNKSDEVLCYYEQGFKLGYDEAQLDMIHKMNEFNIELSLISKIANMSLTTIKNLLK